MTAFSPALCRFGNLPIRPFMLAPVLLASLLGFGTTVHAQALPQPAAVVIPSGPGTTTAINPLEKKAAAVTQTKTSTPSSALSPLAGPSEGGKSPVDIQADNAIEWHQDAKAYVARGHASATRGKTTVYADVLTAYYRETKDKGNDVYRMTAEGNVHLVTPTQQVFGEHGVYDTDRKVGVMTGSGLKLVTQNDVVTARDSLEYYDETKLAVARGDAIAVRGQDRMRSDTMVAQFKEDANGNQVMERIDGIGGVVITTATDVAICKRVMYQVSTDIAVLVDDVKITRGDDQINGDAAEMNMKSHVNRVLSGGRRVEGLLNPQDKDKKPGEAKAGAKPETKPSQAGPAAGSPAIAKTVAPTYAAPAPAPVAPEIKAVVATPAPVARAPAPVARAPASVAQPPALAKSPAPPQAADEVPAAPPTAHSYKNYPSVPKLAPVEPTRPVAPTHSVPSYPAVF